MRLAMVLSLLLLSPPVLAMDKLVVFTVNYPLQYFAQRIAGDYADVILPAPPNVDPAFWQPDTETTASYQNADLILLNGAGYAKWLNRVSLPRRKLVDTSAGFKKDLIVAEGGITHSHGREGDHSHAGTAFTTWLDLTQAVQQARAVRDALSRLRPEYRAAFDKNYAELERDLLELDARVKAIVAAKPETPLLASHPVYQYLTRRYQLNLDSVMWEPDVLPSAAEWQHLEQSLKRRPAKWMLWESAPDSENVLRLRKLGVESVVFDPCANQPAAGDFLSVMSGNVANLRRAFQ